MISAKNQAYLAAMVIYGSFPQSVIGASPHYCVKFCFWSNEFKSLEIQTSFRRFFLHNISD